MYAFNPSPSDPQENLWIERASGNPHLKMGIVNMIGIPIFKMGIHISIQTKWAPHLVLLEAATKDGDPHFMFGLESV